MFTGVLPVHYADFSRAEAGLRTDLVIAYLAVESVALPERRTPPRRRSQMLSGRLGSAVGFSSLWKRARSRPPLGTSGCVPFAATPSRNLDHPTAADSPAWWNRKIANPMAARTHMNPTIAFSEPPPAPPIRRGKNGRSTSQPMVAKATTAQNVCTEWGDIAAVAERVTSTHRTDRVTVVATLAIRVTTESC